MKGLAAISAPAGTILLPRSSPPGEMYLGRMVCAGDSSRRVSFTQAMKYGRSVVWSYWTMGMESVPRCSADMISAISVEYMERFWDMWSTNGEIKAARPSRAAEVNVMTSASISALSKVWVRS